MPRVPLPARIVAFLDAPREAVVATLRGDGAPVTAATWYGWLDGDRFLLSMADDGPRARNLARDGRVALTVFGDDWYDHVSLRGRVVELRPDPDGADVDALSLRYRGVPYPREAAFRPLTAIVQVEGWDEFRSTTRTADAGAETP